METICNKISNDDLIVNVRTLDIFYEYECKNKKNKREEKAIFITYKDMETKLYDVNIDNFFIDVTYKIVPKNKMNYKLLTITGYDKNNNSTYILFCINKV